MKTLLAVAMLAMALGGLPISAAFGQSPGTLPTPLPEPFSPNGVLRPIIPYQQAVPMPNTRPLAVIPLPTQAPITMVAPLGKPSSDVAAEAQNLIKQVPMHRTWPVLQPRDTPKPPAGGSATAAPTASRTHAAAISNTFGAQKVPAHRRPLGW